MSSLKRSILRQRPRLLYAGIGGDAARTAEVSEIVFISKGSGKAEIGEHAFPFAAGDLLLFNRGCEHKETFDTSVDARELIFIGIGNLHILGLSPDALLKDREFYLIHTDSFADTLRTYTTQLVAETEGTQPMHEAVAESLLRIVLLLSLRLAAFDASLTFGENADYVRAKEYFDEHFTEIDDVSDVCKSLYVNKYYLSHLFTKETGMPPVKYLISKRIELACKLLETSDDNVADIGAKCGYTDPCYFNRVFKKVKGLTPLRYRYLFKEKNK
ncbi:MAG: AraC family transcriptional regulator [Clostridiales bacterium]|nr:AraC family transcriptional regulator [Clostridiales bacterium]